MSDEVFMVKRDVWISRAKSLPIRTKIHLNHRGSTQNLFLLQRPGKLAQLKPRLFPNVHGHNKRECHIIRTTPTVIFNSWKNSTEGNQGHEGDFRFVANARGMDNKYMLH